MNKYRVVLEVECDPSESHGLPLEHPLQWNWSHLLRAGGYDVRADVLSVSSIEEEVDA